MLTLLLTALRRLAAERRRRIELRGLLDKDDRLLADMGLTRTEIEVALALPYTESACTAARRLSTRSLALDGLC